MCLTNINLGSNKLVLLRNFKIPYDYKATKGYEKKTFCTVYYNILTVCAAAVAAVLNRSTCYPVAVLICSTWNSRVDICCLHRCPPILPFPVLSSPPCLLVRLTLFIPHQAVHPAPVA